MTIIGGADGPTQVFIASSNSFINVFGLIVVILMLVPNIIYGIKHKDAVNKCENRAMNIIEQAGRYACMLLMAINIGFAEEGFASAAAAIAYAVGNAALLLAYLICWLVYFKKETPPLAMAMALIPTVIFLLSGFAMRHWLLAIFALVFGIGHIYVTAQNVRTE